MAIDQSTGRDPVGQADVRHFLHEATRGRPAANRVRLREFSFRFSSPTQAQTLVASLKESLQWVANQGHDRPGLQPASPLPTYQL